MQVHAHPADVGRLLAEVEAAANAAGTAAQEAQTRALDLLLPRDAVTVARREMDDPSFTRDRLSEAARRLGERLNELRALEKARAQRAEHERVQAERDRLAAEMERMGEPIAEIAASSLRSMLATARSGISTQRQAWPLATSGQL